LSRISEELAEIHSPIVKQLYVMAKANQLAHVRIGEYLTVIAASDMTGHDGVGVLLESRLADKTPFAQRARQLIRTPPKETLPRTSHRSTASASHDREGRARTWSKTFSARCIEKISASARQRVELKTILFKWP
jgi:hypothetical protein